MTTVLAICINYKTPDAACSLAREYLALPIHSANLRACVAVVDNSPAELKISDTAFPQHSDALLIDPSANLGYLGGAAFGLKEARARGIDPDFVIVTNSDIHFRSPDFLDRLAEQEGSAGVIAPSIVSSRTGLDQNPYMKRRPSRLKVRGFTALHRSPRLFAAYARLRTAVRRGRPVAKRSQKGPGNEIYAPHGSFMVFTRRYFEAGGSLEYPSFLFGEELWVAEICRKLGLNIRYSPEIAVEHAEHLVTGDVRRPELVRYAHDSMKFLASTYFIG